MPFAEDNAMRDQHQAPVDLSCQTAGRNQAVWMRLVRTRPRAISHSEPGVAREPHLGQQAQALAGDDVLDPPAVNGLADGHLSVG